MKTRSFLLLTTLAVASMSQAQMLFSQQPIVNQEGGPFSEIDRQQVADTMVPIASGQAEFVTFWGSMGANGDPFNVGDQFDFNLVTWDRDANGDPLNILNQVASVARITSEVGINGFGDMLYKYEMSLNGVGPNLTAGGKYMISVWESDPDTPVNNWRWHNAVGPHDYIVYRVDQNDIWRREANTERSDLAIGLMAVPEPASFVTLSLAGLLALRKRRRA